MEGRNNQDKRRQLWRSLVPDFCLIKHSATFLLIYSRTQMRLMTTPENWRMIRILNCRHCSEGGHFQVVLSSSEKLLQPVRFSLSLLLTDLVGQANALQLQKKKKNCFWERPHFMHPQALEAGLLKQVVWEFWEDEYTYSSLVFQWNKLASRTMTYLLDKVGERLTLGGNWWCWQHRGGRTVSCSKVSSLHQRKYWHSLYFWGLCNFYQGECSASWLSSLCKELLSEQP